MSHAKVCAEVMALAASAARHVAVTDFGAPNYCRAASIRRSTHETPIIGFAFDSQVGIHAFGGDADGYRAKPNSSVCAGC